LRVIINTFILDVVFLNVINVMKEEDMKFVRQSQTIKVTNVNNKVQTEKEIRKHGNMLPIFIRRTICGPSKSNRFACGKTNVFISLLESPYGIRFKNVYVYSKSLQAKISILGEFISTD